MLINIRNLPGGRSVAEQNVVFDEQPAAETGIDGPIACRAEIDSLQDRICLFVTFSCGLRLSCSRCLEEFVFNMAGDCRLVLQDAGTLPAGKSENENADFYYSEDDEEIDIRSALYDEIVTGLPMMPLCSPGCRGISVREAGDTGETATDPRWEALLKLRKQ